MVEGLNGRRSPEKESAEVGTAKEGSRGGESGATIGRHLKTPSCLRNNRSRGNAIPVRAKSHDQYGHVLQKKKAPHNGGGGKEEINVDWSSIGGEKQLLSEEKRKGGKDRCVFRRTGRKDTKKRSISRDKGGEKETL